MADRDAVLLFKVCEERTLVVDLEGKDAVLVGDQEGSGVDARFGLGLVWKERDAVVGVEHGEFELEAVRRRDGEGDPVVVGPFRKLDFKCLE